MIHELPQLPYGLDDLKPIISQHTLDFHYGKHHQAYVSNLNKLIVGTKFEESDLETIIKESEGPVYNNGAQIWNHTFYFNQFSPKGGGQPTGQLSDAIIRDFGSFTEFKDQFSKAAVSLFGSGWAWLIQNSEGKLQIVQESNAGNPIRNGLKPLFTIDVWEHAYYIDFQNRRADHVGAIWEIIDWKTIETRYI